jgi:glycosyltransferase involved in cell wall biosynthesis
MTAQGDMLKFSVITATLNRLDFLRKCTHSVLDQDYEQVEHVVVDGGSTDGTVEFLQSLSVQYGDRIRWVSGPDNGISDALNKGLGMATGDVISCMGSDDSLMPGALRVVSRHLEEAPGALWVYGSGVIVDEKGRRIRLRRAKEFRHALFIRTCLFFGPSVFVRRELALRGGPLREDLKYAMDYEWYLRLATIAAPHKVDDVLSSFGWHRGSVTSAQRLAQLDESLDISRSYARGGWEKAYITAAYKFYKVRAWAWRRLLRALQNS